MLAVSVHASLGALAERHGAALEGHPKPSIGCSQGNLGNASHAVCWQRRCMRAWAHW